ncbi:tetratricopeptide repeat protein [Aquicella lusitana]|uniref:Tetratricopeptide repeat protein n=1 Tax=Aquicella lusitana TaxID=254246 RepID=A0A370GYI2_9COXI|nr:tetratricopeptide repeat protein [Aquicella lusitana]RDI48708.1 tetratricopeptide repeat protein [Aquicella lusitana]VVC73915.1 hypothetical protein AQULUS_16750 [Aquicella lusitana]
MKYQSIIRYGFALAFLLSAPAVLAEQETAQAPTADLVIQKDKIYNPNALSFDSVQIYEKNFDPTQHHSVSAENQKKIDEIEIFIKKTDPNAYTKLSAADQEAFGRIAYKLGRYYLLDSRNPELALPKLELAATLLKKKQDKAWSYNYLAFAYEQKYAISDEDADKTKALDYSNKVISSLYPKAKNREVAFAYYVNGLVQKDAADYDQAKNSFETAITIYEALPEGKDDHLAVAKNSLADTLLIQDGHDQEALALLQQVDSYWKSKGNNQQNPHAAQNLLSLGEAYLKIGDSKTASDQIKKAIQIMQNVYGSQSPLLIEPYELLSSAYIKLGDQKLASVYERKANALSKS